MNARICVNMIVKDESAIIDRCCQALARVVDCFVICDTGSTDDTVARIEAAFAAHGIPGEIVRTNFIDFEQARNEALDAARASTQRFDYVLLCDADMEIVEVDPEWRSRLSAPAYGLLQRSVGGLEYPNVRLVRRDHPARYIGATHEYLDIGGPWTTLGGLHFIDHAAGSSRSQKYQRDIDLLTRSLERDPDNARSVFYLANSYYDLGDFEQAIHFYRRRITMGGYTDEIFISTYRTGLAREALGDEAAMYRDLLYCFDQFPHRAEPIHRLAFHAQRAGQHHLALGLARMAIGLEKPESGLFVEAEVYEWRLADIIAVSLYWTGEAQQALQINERLVDVVPDAHRPRILDNLEHCRRRIAEA